MLRAALLLLLATLSSGPARANPLMALVRADRWVEAAALAAELPDPLAGKLVAYFRLLSPHGASAGEIAAFVAANPDWPQQAALARRRDEALAAEPDDMAALPLCGQAQSAPALERCAQGDLRQGHDAAATAAARAAWLLLPPDRNAEAEFLRLWAPRLTEADHWQRFDRLMWDGADAAAQLQRLDPGDRLRAEARLALRHDEPRAASLLGALGPVERAEPGMLLERARWLRRGNHDAEAAALWRTEDAAAEHAVAAVHLPAFWIERNILARRRLRDGDAEAAYALAAGAAQIAPEQVAEAAFLAGWVALRRLSDPSRAATQFRLLARVSSSAITLARGQYWQARAAAAAGDAAAVAQAYAAAAAWPSTYYGQLAALALNADPVGLNARIRASRDPAASQEQAVGFTTRELVRASATLVAWGEKRRGGAFLLQIAEAAPEPANLALAARLANGFGLPEAAVALARLAGRDGAVLLDAGWPLSTDLPRPAVIDAALALAVARQESSFDTAAVSPAGARGLLQLMPATAAQQARKLGLGVSVPALTTDPAYNLALGIATLHGLLERYDGAEPLAAAAYNAGPARADEWLRANGDPRRPGGDMLDWIELVPFSETRNYVQRVIESLVVYRAKLDEKLPHPVLRWLESHA